MKQVFYINVNELNQLTCYNMNVLNHTYSAMIIVNPAEKDEEVRKEKEQEKPQLTSLQEIKNPENNAS